MSRIVQLSSYLTPLLLLACTEVNSLGSLDTTTGSTGATAGETASSTAATPTGTGETGDIATTEPGEATEPAESGASSTDTGTQEQSYIVVGDFGSPRPCDCPDDELCVGSHGVDSWFPVCAIPPAGCDPKDPCSQACASACAMPPPLPGGCDGPDLPESLQCPNNNGFQCSPWAENCAEGSKCVPHEWDPDIRCQPIVEQPAGLGEPCTGPIDNAQIDTCVEGAGCWGRDPSTRQSICVAHCTGTVADPVCPPETGCLLDPGGYLAVCLPICDPLLQDCGAGLSCVPGIDSFVCLADLSGGAGQALDTCQGLEFCDPGQLCFDSAQLPDCENQKTCCTPYCDLGDPACAVPGTTCEAMFARGEAPPGAVDVGVCVLP